MYKVQYMYNYTNNYTVTVPLPYSVSYKYQYEYNQGKEPGPTRCVCQVNPISRFVQIYAPFWENRFQRIEGTLLHN